MKTLELRCPPSVLAFMLRALAPKWGRRTVPRMEIVLKDQIIGSCDELFRLCGLSPEAELPRWFPLVKGFRLVMRAVTDPAFPEPIWGALQVRNHIRQNMPLTAGIRGDYRLRVGEGRQVRRGLEVDFHLSFSRDGAEIWSAVVTFYWRNPRIRVSVERQEDPLPQQAAEEEERRVRCPVGGAFRYGRISGDFNGIHLTRFWARLFGFPRAFLHPHRLLGVMQGKIGSGPGELRVWFRGPVPYGESATVRLSSDAGFLHLEAARPALVAAWKSP